MPLADDFPFYYTCLNCASYNKNKTNLCLRNQFYGKCVKNHSHKNCLIFPNAFNGSSKFSKAKFNGINNYNNVLINADNTRRMAEFCLNNCYPKFNTDTLNSTGGQVKRKLCRPFGCDAEEESKMQRQDSFKRCRKEHSNNFLFPRTSNECHCNEFEFEGDYNPFNFQSTRTLRQHRSIPFMRDEHRDHSLCAMNTIVSSQNSNVSSDPRITLFPNKINFDVDQRLGLFNIKKNLIESKKNNCKLFGRNRKCLCCTHKNTVRKKQKNKFKKRANMKNSNSMSYKRIKCSQPKGSNNKVKKMQKSYSLIKIKHKNADSTVGNKSGVSLKLSTKSVDQLFTKSHNFSNKKYERRYKLPEQKKITKKKQINSEKIPELSERFKTIKNTTVKKRKNHFTNTSIICNSKLTEDQRQENKTKEKTNVTLTRNSGKSKANINNNTQNSSNFDEISNNDKENGFESHNLRANTPIYSVSSANIKKNTKEKDLIIMPDNKFIKPELHYEIGNKNAELKRNSNAIIVKQDMLAIKHTEMDEEIRKNNSENKSFEFPLIYKSTCIDKNDNLTNQTNLESLVKAQDLYELLNGFNGHVERIPPFKDTRKLVDDQALNTCKNIVFLVVENPDCKMGCCYRVYRQCTTHGVTVPANRYTSLHDGGRKPSPVNPVPDNLEISTCQLLKEKIDPECTSVDLSEVIFIANNNMKRTTNYQHSKNSGSTYTMDD